MNTEIAITYLDKSVLVPLEGNPRKVLDPDTIDKLKLLIKEHGFQNPLQVYREADGRYSILCGNHRFRAAVELGVDRFPCIEYHGTREMALARAVSDNKSSDWTEWDFPLLKDLMADLDDGEFNMELTGFDSEELAEMFGHVNFGPGTEDEQGRLDEKKKVECPECGHLFEA